jgi:hypothetical protein
MIPKKQECTNNDYQREKIVESLISFTADLTDGGQIDEEMELC